VTGTPVNASAPQRYRPRQAQRDIAGTMTEYCRFPSCRQPAWRCDLDHRTAYNHHHPASGGATDDHNLDPLCRRHHMLKHHSDWTPRRQSDGTVTWKSPTGHTYSDPPREITLPGELLRPTSDTRTTIGSADPEHRTACSPPPVPGESTPRAFSVRSAVRADVREQARARIASLKAHRIRREVLAANATPPPKNEAADSAASNSDDRQSTLTGLPRAASTGTKLVDHGSAQHGSAYNDAAQTDPRWLAYLIPATVQELKAKSGFTSSTFAEDDDEPPF
jgi:hypothetical protein